jgi:uncharacterized protein YpmB
MSESAKKAVLVLAIAFVIFWFTKPSKKDKTVNRSKLPELVISDEDLAKNDNVPNAAAAMKAYISAWNNNENDDLLNQFVDDLKKEFNVVVYWKGAKLAAKDLQGNDILINK